MQLSVPRKLLKRQKGWTIGKSFSLTNFGWRGQNRQCPFITPYWALISSPLQSPMMLMWPFLPSPWMCGWTVNTAKGVSVGTRDSISHGSLRLLFTLVFQTTEQFLMWISGEGHTPEEKSLNLLSTWTRSWRARATSCGEREHAVAREKWPCQLHTIHWRGACLGQCTDTVSGAPSYPRLGFLWTSLIRSPTWGTWIFSGVGVELNDPTL